VQPENPLHGGNLFAVAAGQGTGGQSLTEEVFCTGSHTSTITVVTVEPHRRSARQHGRVRRHRVPLPRGRHDEAAPVGRR
jgi:hypothetical protein